MPHFQRRAGTNQVAFVIEQQWWLRVGWLTGMHMLSAALWPTEPGSHGERVPANPFSRTEGLETVVRFSRYLRPTYGRCFTVRLRELAKQQEAATDPLAMLIQLLLGESGKSDLDHQLVGHSGFDTDFLGPLASVR